MVVKGIDILLALTLNLLHGAYSEHILSCNVTAFDPCPGENQICKEATKQCECAKGFTLVGENCESPNSQNIYAEHSTTTTVVTIFTLVLIVSGLVLVIRKYNVLDYVRQKINARRNNDVMYEDVMIGNDDPPLSP